MEISKAHWASTGTDVTISMPFAKVDTERRIVTGFATLDNLDRQNDIVPSEASMKAFKNFRGNIREMHQPIAAGKLVSFTEGTYFDEKTSQTYKGVIVSAYVSKGAQSTWEKVLDGTLTGFSIAGAIKNDEPYFDEKIGKSVRIIKDYELTELSLVDSPANQYANVLSIQKGSDSGYLEKTLIENVFWCGNDDVVQLSSATSSDCPRCDITMKNIGFVESDDADKGTVVKGLLNATKNNDEQEVRKMDNDTNEAVAESTEVAEVAKSDEAVADVVEKADEVAEVAEETTEKADGAEVSSQNEEPVVEKDIEILTDMAKKFEETTNSLATVLDSLADTVKSLVNKVDGLEKKASDVESKVDTVQNEFGKRVEAVEKDTAFRKSGDLGEIVQETVINKSQESLWGGRFLTKSDLFK
jgi:archaellum component FlaC